MLCDDSLGRRVASAEATVFQGRRVEVEAVLERLGDPARLPGVVSLTGPPGIGKTALVYALGRACRDRSTDVAIIDSRDFRHTLPGLRGAVRFACAAAGREGNGIRPEAAVPGRPARPLLLVLDTFEEMRDLEDQLWESFLPSLRGPVLVVLSGRFGPGARSQGWRLVTDEIALTALPDDQARLLLADLGVTDDDAVNSIVDLAGGSPLLLSVAAEVHRSGAMSGASDLEVPGEVARSLIARMSRELRRPDVRELLQAASLVRTFDEELLAAMTGDAATETFDALCDLSVVRVTPAGARVHDVVRQTLSAELRWRAPQRYSLLRRRAAEHLLARRAEDDSGQAVPELLHLVGDTVGPRRFFADATDRGVRLRPAHADDLADLERVCQRGRHNFGWAAGQSLRQLRADFSVAMDWFVLATVGGQVVAYSYSLPLNRETFRAVASARGGYFAALPEPERAAIQQAPPGASAAFLIAGTVALPSHLSAEPALRLATFTNRHVRAPSVSRSYVLMPQNSLFEPTAVSLGMTRRLAGITMYKGEPDASEWILDYGEHGFASWVHSSLRLPDHDSPLDLVSDDVLAGQVKLALEDLYRPASLEQSPLVRLHCIGPGAGRASGLRGLLLGLLEELSHSGQARDREAAALLRSYYVKQAGSHEVVAERLGLPRTTFYRRLRHGLELLATQIRVTEALSVTPAGTESGTGSVPG
jgi:hypothetical protein